MKLNNVTARLSETEIETLIKEAVQANTGLKVASVSFNVGQRTTGYGMSETTTPYFEGATVTFEEDRFIKEV